MQKKEEKWRLIEMVIDKITRKLAEDTMIELKKENDTELRVCHMFLRYLKNKRGE
jgi:hypothetical protein